MLTRSTSKTETLMPTDGNGILQAKAHTQTQYPQSLIRSWGNKSWVVVVVFSTVQQVGCMARALMIIHIWPCIANPHIPVETVLHWCSVPLHILQHLCLGFLLQRKSSSARQLDYHSQEVWLPSWLDDQEHLKISKVFNCNRSWCIANKELGLLMQYQPLSRKY